MRHDNTVEVKKILSGNASNKWVYIINFLFCPSVIIKEVSPVVRKFSGRIEGR